MWILTRLAEFNVNNIVNYVQHTSRNKNHIANANNIHQLQH